jgi:glycosyltransferase involved in cell wall biosynthesis
MRSLAANLDFEQECGGHPELSIVVPCYNEGEVLSLLKKRLMSTLERLGLDWDVIFVDDGSNDDTLSQMTAMHYAEPRFKVVSLSRNFGHQTAIVAGLEHAQ